MKYANRTDRLSLAEQRRSRCNRGGCRLLRPRDGSREVITRPETSRPGKTRHRRPLRSTAWLTRPAIARSTSASGGAIRNHTGPGRCSRPVMTLTDRRHQASLLPQAAPPTRTPPGTDPRPGAPQAGAPCADTRRFRVSRRRCTRRGSSRPGIAALAGQPTASQRTFSRPAVSRPDLRLARTPDQVLSLPATPA
jgi:hypothetical protein